MSRKILMGGNIAIAEGAILAGCGAYFGYPITPQNDLLEHMSHRMPEEGRVFLQTESELAAINMVYGAVAVGFRAMTSTSSPGFSLQQEGISYMAGSEMPGVIVNVMRAGPGLGNIGGAQGDYFQSTKGGGHGDYSVINLAPASVQEMMDLTMLSFELADKYRNPVVVLADGFLGQVMEPVVMREPVTKFHEKKWALTGAKDRPKNVINSFEMNPANHPGRIKQLLHKFEKIKANEVRYEALNLDDAEIVLVAYGSAARSAMSAMDMARERKLRVGLLRPVTVFPFPYQPLADLAEKGCKFVVAEMSGGQMIEDVRIAVGSDNEIKLVNSYGGVPLTADDIFEAIDILM
ncbi:MAG: 3-methyl-2-oxobutanoate dehydrogenase subunit VorB [Dehalococcoidia bacterium]|nr:3-methyl-2-oxobutanoate dehydrogenase subunit VorB [Dehalococcoidia bacterium]MDD5494536.1 3-methyl-2-oxobutanoate dehydrogenase subunit VorB [Dehalococcoidia bacterium]